MSFLCLVHLETVKPSFVNIFLSWSHYHHHQENHLRESMQFLTGPYATLTLHS